MRIFGQNSISRTEGLGSSIWYQNVCNRLSLQHEIVKELFLTCTALTQFKKMSVVFEYFGEM